MTHSGPGPIEALMERSRGAAGPPADVDFGVPGRSWSDLRRLLTISNGGSLFNAGVQIFRAGDVGVGPDLQTWNDAATWKDTYGGVADDLFCFAQDVLGVQFAIDRSAQVVTFDPESAGRMVLGTSLEDWAIWLLDDPDTNGAGAVATRWQDEFGALDHDDRLIAREFFVLGGSFEVQNLKVENSVRAMRIRGPVAAQIHDLPDGAPIRIETE